jgi:erythromycin esterase
MSSSWLIFILLFIPINISAQVADTDDCNTFIINSISPNCEDISDLEFLKEVLRDKKVVFLGERAHSDGSSIDAKHRLIKFLVEEMGFEGVIVEMDFLLGNKIWQFLNRKYKNDELVNYFFRENEFSSIKEYGFFVNYISKQKLNTDFTFASLDVEPRMNKEFINDLKKHSSKSLINEYRKLVVGDKHKMSNRDFNKLSVITNKLILSIHKNMDARFLEQCLRNNLAYFDWMKKRPDYNLGKLQKYNTYNQLRDKQMADNVLWLLNNYYKDKKVIISTSISTSCVPI